MSSINVKKQQQRILLKKIRLNVDLLRRQQASKAACHFLYHLSHDTPFILSFASTGTEINLWELNMKLAEEGRLVLPRIEGEHLQLFHVTNCENLKPHPYGFVEPVLFEASRFDPSKLKIAFIPGLGFDPETKFRLGYGKGYYDRLLKTMENLQTYGVGFREQCMNDLSYDSHDIPMKHILLF